mgnify:CR=1 FL=1|jgi:hypothetical protein
MVYLMESRKVDGKTASGMELIGWYNLMESRKVDGKLLQKV